MNLYIVNSIQISIKNNAVPAIFKRMLKAFNVSGLHVFNMFVVIYTGIEIITPDIVSNTDDITSLLTVVDVKYTIDILEAKINDNITESTRIYSNLILVL